jgi:BirA family biotin operon repressor/biotin-[acetyl-CoA-carboxylase] ligase
MPMPPNFADSDDRRWDTRARALVHALGDGRFHSGEELGAAAGIGRAAVWKLVEQLRDAGLRVDAVRGRGYRLGGAVELLDEAALATHLGRSLPVEVRFRCASTNRLLLERARAGAGAQALLTEVQSAGRGRWGRRWVSPFGNAVCLSVLWQFPPLPHGLAGLSLAVAVGAAEALAAEGVPAQLKWPNDLLLAGRKLGGILIELVGEVEGPCAVVIGLGLNLAGAQAIAEQADQPVAALEQAIGQRAHQRNRLAARFISAITRACEQFAIGGFAAFAPRWQRYDMLAGVPVVLALPSEEVRGVARGVDSRGALLLERDGRIETRYSGDLRLRLRRDTAA